MVLLLVLLSGATVAVLFGMVFVVDIAQKTDEWLYRKYNKNFFWPLLVLVTFILTFLMLLWGWAFMGVFDNA